MSCKAVGVVDFYCSEIGESLSNRELYQEFEENFFPTLDKKYKALYRKLLFSDPDRKRNITHPIHKIATDQGSVNRLERYKYSISKLMTDCVAGLFCKTGRNPNDIDFIVVTSSVGKTMPSLASLVAKEFDFSPNTVTLNLGDMACSSGLAALDAGRRFLASEKRPCRCLVVSLEASTNLLNGGKDSVVPNVVFGEGSAAVLLSTHKEDCKFTIQESVRTITTDADAFSVISFKESSDGPWLELSRNLPKVAGKGIHDNLSEFVPRIMNVGEKIRYALTRNIPDWRAKIDYWCIHPGGTEVIKAFGDKLDIPLGQLAGSYRTFSSRSNMSSPSVFYVLSELEKFGCKKGESIFMMSFGSGFKVNTTLLMANKSMVKNSENTVDIIANEESLRIRCVDSKGHVKTSLHAIDDSLNVATAAMFIWRSLYGIDRLNLILKKEVADIERVKELVKLAMDQCTPNSEVIYKDFQEVLYKGICRRNIVEKIFRKVAKSSQELGGAAQ